MNKLCLVVNVGGIPKALRQVAVTRGCLIDRAFSHLIYHKSLQAQYLGVFLSIGLSHPILALKFLRRSGSLC